MVLLGESNQGEDGTRVHYSPGTLYQPSSQLPHFPGKCMRAPILYPRRIAEAEASGGKNTGGYQHRRRRCCLVLLLLLLVAVTHVTRHFPLSL